MEAKTRKNILFIVFILIAAGGGFWLYRNYTSEPGTSPTSLIPTVSVTVPGTTEPDITQRIFSPDLKMDVLSDPRFSELVIYGDVPLEIEELGRENPFLPFNLEEEYGVEPAEEPEE